MPLPEKPRVSARRVALREVDASDLPDLLQINGDPEVTRFLPYATWVSEEDGEAWLQRMQRLSAEAGARQLVVVRVGDRRVIGTALLFKFDEASRRVEIGYVIGRAYWGQGYAQEALQALLSYLFAELGLRRVEAEVDPDNVASNALLLRLGFTREGHLRSRYEAKGRVYGVNVYGLLSHEWPANSA